MTRLDTFSCLGAGGEHPRVDAFCPKTRTVVPLVTTSPGQSVYRVLVHREGGSLIIGTKSGVVQHCRLENTALGTEPAVVGRTSGHIGGPLLSLADLGNDLIAASSMNGSLSILRSQDLAGVKIARTAGPAICGIASVTDDTFATLDECGCIELRSLPDGMCLRFTKAQPPPARWGSVRLDLWKQQGVLVYPGRGGHLVMVDVASGVTKSVQAHVGDFYAVCLADDMLTTFGLSEGLSRFWNPNLSEAETALGCIKGVVSAAFLDDTNHQVVAVCEDGRALCLEKGEGCTRVGLTLPGAGYRAAWSPDFDAVGEAARQRRNEGLRETAYEIAGKLDSGVADGHEVGLRKVKEDGHILLFHALSAKVAEAGGDAPTALAHYLALSALIPRPCPRAAERPMARFADLLSRSWQFSAALRVYDSVLRANPGHRCAEAADRIRNMMLAAGDRPCLVEAEISVPDLIACADASGNPFTGTWITKAFDTLRCPGLGLTAEDQETMRARVDGAVMSADWTIGLSDVASLNGAGVRISRAISARSAAPSLVSLAYFARFMAVNRDLLVRPCVVLSVRSSPEGTTPGAHNGAVADAWSRLREDDSAWRDMFSIHGCTVGALRAMLTARAGASLAVGGRSV